jgi:hypothetical protein
MRIAGRQAHSLLALLVIWLSFPAHAQKQGDCTETSRREMLGLVSLMPEGGTPAYGAEMTKLEILGRIRLCFETSGCQFSDQLTIYDEMMVDEQIVQLQRLKISTAKRFFEQFQGEGDSCKLEKALPSLWARLEKINLEQVSRLKALAERRFPPIPQAK